MKKILVIVTVPYISTEIHRDYARESLESLKRSIIKDDIEVINVGIVNYATELDSDLFLEYYNYIEQNDVNCLSRAWNKGINLAINKYAADYILLPNLDIIAHPLCIARIIAAIDKTENKDEVFWSATTLWDKEALNLKFTEEGYSEAPDFSFFMVKPSIVDKVGYFDEQFTPAYYEDNDFHRRILLEGCKAVSVNHAKFFHYGSATIKNDADLEKKNVGTFVLNQQKYVAKWGGLPGKETFTIPYNGVKIDSSL